MDDSDDQGFHQATLQFTIVKVKNQGLSPRKSIIARLPFNRQPTSLHHELKLYEYPKQLKYFRAPKNEMISLESDDPLQQIRLTEDSDLLLSEFFPRKMACVYNRFRQNLLVKQDMTGTDVDDIGLIRNLSRRICNDQLAKFQALPKPTHKHGISFSADFEGGNLHCVFKCKKTGYHYMFLQDDVNTHGYNIWFHFNVTAAQSGKYKFVIVNLTRPIKYAQQLTLLTCSSISKSYERKVGFKCQQSRFKNCETKKPYYSLCFEYQFREGETVYFSPTPPYSYTKLMDLLESIETYYRHTNLYIQAAAKSEIGNTIPFVKISSKERPSKHVIVITARQHPCETVGSFICEHIIRLLLSQSQRSLQILRKYTFVIVPMVNVDGVIHGNSRTNLLGYDLNRSWEGKVPYKSIQCHLLWEFLMKTNEDNDQIRWLFDLHGHSKELGQMAYFAEDNEETQIYHYLHRIKSSLYIKQRCLFGISGSKVDSLRGKMYEKLKVKNSVTIQISYYGFKDSNGVFENWNDHHFLKMAQNILDTLLETQKVLHNRHLKQQVLTQIGRSPKPIRALSSKHQKELDSDSDPQEGYLKHQQRQQFHLTKARQKVSANNIDTLEFKKSPLLTELSSSKYISEAATMSRRPPKKEKLVKSTRKSSQNEIENSSNNLSFTQSKKKDRPQPRQIKLIQNRRKIFSQHKYVIDNNQFQQLKTAQYSSTIKKTYGRKKSLRGITNQTSQTQRAKTQFSKNRLQRSRGDSTEEESTGLHTIVYPTSSFAGYSLNTQFRAVRAKMMGLRGTSSTKSRKILLNNFNKSFYSRSQTQIK